MPSPASDPSVRQSGLGASDAAPAMGLSKWKTPLDLYLQKRGVVPSDAGESEAIKMGNLLEPVILQRYAQECGLVVAGRDARGEVVGFCPDGVVRDAPVDAHELLDTLRHAERDHLFCHIDGIAFTHLDTPDHLVEAKSSLGRLAYGADWGDDGTDEVPREYIAQAQHQIEVVRSVLSETLPVAIPAILAGPRWNVYRVVRHPEFVARMLDMEDELWDRVRSHRPPEATPDDRGEKALALLYPHSSGPERVVLDTEPLHFVALSLHEATQRRKDAEAEEKGLKNAIKMAMRDAGKLVGPGWKVSWTEVSPKPKTDYEAAFKRLVEMTTPDTELVDDVLASVTETRGGYRRFMFTPGKDLK